MKTLFASLLILFLGSGAAHSQEKEAGLRCLKEVTDIRLPGRPVRFDYQSIDPQRGLLFISHLGDNSVVVFNLRSAKVVKNIGGVPDPHGLLAVPRLGMVFVSATRTNEIYEINERSLKVIAKAPAGYFPDGIAYAPDAGRLFVSDEFGKTVAVVQAGSMKLIAKIDIGGTVGNSHYDPVSKTVLTANGTTNELVAIDPSSLKIVERISLPGCRGAHGFAIGENPHFAYVTGEDNASLLVADLAGKKVIQRFSVGGVPDVLAVDKKLRLLYVSSESGVVSVFKIGTMGLTRLCQGKLWAHAHTVSVDQATHRVYFPLQDWNGVPAMKVMVPRSADLPPSVKRPR